MTKPSIISRYLLITYAIIAPLCGIVLLLRFLNISYQNSAAGFLFIAIGGLSTAIAGAVTAKKSAQISSYIEILKDFFHLKQPLPYYGLPLIFLLICFGTRLVGGGIRHEQGWLMILWFFLRAILFGGIEEIGWRYLFQPRLETKFSFLSATLLTTVCWGIWHMMYNVLDGTAFTMGGPELLGFFIGLLVTSLATGCVYHITSSLWLCVFYHALSNAFIMTLPGLNNWEYAVVLLFVLGTALILVRNKERVRKLAG